MPIAFFMAMIWIFFIARELVSILTVYIYIYMLYKIYPDSIYIYTYIYPDSIYVCIYIYIP